MMGRSEYQCKGDPDLPLTLKLKYLLCRCSYYNIEKTCDIHFISHLTFFITFPWGLGVIRMIRTLNGPE